MHEIQRRLDNGFGLTAASDLMVEYSGLANARRSLGGLRAYKLITSAQLLALFATPIEVVPAQGAGVAIVPIRMTIYKPAGTAYAGIAAGEDLVLKYTDAAGQQISSVIETTGFLDSAAAQTRVAFPPATVSTTAGDITPVANAAVVLHLLTAEIITGTSPLHVEVIYDIARTVFTS